MQDSFLKPGTAECNVVSSTCLVKWTMMGQNLFYIPMVRIDCGLTALPRIVDNQTIVCNNFITIEGIKSRLTRARTKKKVTFVLIRRGSILLGEFCFEIS